MSQFNYLNIEKFPNDQVIELLEENTIGTPGKSMVYKHHDVKKKVRVIPNPYFANLSKGDRLYGTICLSKRSVYSFRKLYEAYYLRYFTFRESLRTNKPKYSSKNHSSKIREDVKKLMNGEGLSVDRDLILYAYVDSENERSKRLIDEFGFQHFGNFSVIPFSRLFPGKSSQVKTSDKSMQEMIRLTLLEFYKDCQLVSLDSLFKHGNYFVLMDNGKMVCGVQAVSDQWDIIDMPGVSGKLLLHVVPKLPILNRLFNPDYKFALLELAFCKEGFENKLSELFESVLHYFQLNTGILCIDSKSKIYSTIKKIGFGLTYKIQGEKKIDIVAKTSKPGILNSNQPFAVSGFDVL